MAMKERTRKLIMLIGLSLSVYVYVTLGALAFIVLEAGEQRALARRSRQALRRALRNFSSEHQECGVTVDGVTDLLRQAKMAWEQDAFRPDADPSRGVDPIWNLADSMFFSMSIVTTIGYGDLVPRTLEGRFFCIFYAAVGIPLCYFMLVMVGRTFQTAWEKLFHCLDAVKRRAARRPLYLIMPVASLWVYLAIIPAVTLMQTEGWPYLKAKYYSFVSLSTIGFGDEQLRRTAQFSAYAYTLKIVFVVYILLGLSIVSITFTGVTTAVKHFKEKMRRKSREEQNNGESCSHLRNGYGTEIAQSSDHEV